ncbi:MAG: hypothetical protein AB3K77_01475 [Methanosarcinaceae archaeon]
MKSLALGWGTGIYRKRFTGDCGDIFFLWMIATGTVALLAKQHVAA